MAFYFKFFCLVFTCNDLAPFPEYFTPQKVTLTNSTYCQYVPPEFQQYNQFPEIIGPNSTNNNLPCNATTQDFVFDFFAPRYIEANKNLTMILVLKETYSRPVSFHVSLFHKNQLLIPAESFTLQSQGMKDFKLQVKELPSVSNSSDKFVLLVSANSSSAAPTKFRLRNLSLKATPRKEILVETNKQRDYSVGENIFYRAIVYDSVSRQPLRHNDTLDIKFTTITEECFLCSEDATNRSLSVSEFVFTGVVAAKQSHEFLEVSIPGENLKETVPLFASKPSAEKFGIQVKSPYEIHFPETTLKLGLKFFQPRETSLPLDANCTIGITIVGDWDTFQITRSVLNKTISFSGNNDKQRVIELNLSKELDWLNQQVDGPRIVTEVTCIDFHTGQQAQSKSKSTFIPTPFVDVVSATFSAPSPVDNITTISIKLITDKPNANQLQNSARNESLIIILNYPDETADDGEKTIAQVISPNEIEADGIIRLTYKLPNVTSLSYFVSRAKIIFQRQDRFTELIHIDWNEAVTLKVNLANENINLRGGDVAKLYVYSDEIINSELRELNIILSTSEQILETSVQVFNLTDKEPGHILEVKIPEDLVEPTSLEIFIFGKCWNCSSSELDEHFTDFTSRVVFGDVDLDVNFEKPILSLLNITNNKENQTTEFLLEVVGIGKHIDHVSLEWTRISEKSQTNAVDMIKKDQFQEEREDHKTIRKALKSKGSPKNKTPKRTRTVKSRETTNVFEFDFPIENNGTVKIRLTLDTKNHFGRHEIRAQIVSDVPGGITKSNAIELTIPSPTNIL